MSVGCDDRDLNVFCCFGCEFFLGGGGRDMLLVGLCEFIYCGSNCSDGNVGLWSDVV